MEENLNVFLPYGIRTNNPGNILLSKTVWQGTRPSRVTDQEFVEFMTPFYGLRALMKTLLTYQLKHGLNTVETLINRYAPPFENDTSSYIRAVCARIKVWARQPIDLRKKAMLVKLAQAIVLQENGFAPPERPPYWYDDAVYQDAATNVLSHML